MQLFVIIKVIGILLIFYSLTLLPPMAVSLWYQDGVLTDFLIPFTIMLIIGLVCWIPTRHQQREIRLRDGFIITTAFWTVLSVVGALPFVFNLGLNFTQAVFESVSGFTTTGATVIVGLDHLPKSILYYRQQLTCLGGLGIIVLAIAVLPMLGIGGAQLYKAEGPGPMRDDKFAPRLRYTATAMIYTYFVLVILCALSFWFAGMTLFDAIGHSFSTIATAGFSTHDDSFAFFQSPLIEAIAIIFMLLGSLNFTVHYMAWFKLDMRYYWYDSQGWVFLGIVFVILVVCVVTLRLTDYYPDFLTALRYASFNFISIITTTGFLTTDYSQWPLFVPVLILGSSFIGGCVGSTAGGLKVLRVILLYKQAVREIVRLIHPNAIIHVKIGGKRVSNRIAEGVWGFTSLYMGSYILLSLLVMGTGLDIVSAFSGVATCMNMTGPGLGTVVFLFKDVSDVGLWILSFSMILGRLEILTVLVLLAPTFWKK